MDIEKYNKIIEEYVQKMIDRNEFDKRIQEITKDCNSPLKEYYIINSYLYNYYYVPKDLRSYLYKNSLSLLHSDQLSFDNKNKIKCALINGYFADYNYEKSELYAIDLLNEFSNDIKVLRELAIYFTKTRRYDLAKNLYKIIINTCGENFILNDYESYKKLVDGKQKPYLPQSDENRKKYILFLEKLGIKIEANILNDKVKNDKQPIKIPVGEYPPPNEYIMPDFNTFVAFDLETTGIDNSKDAIIEIAAIKVVDGIIVEEKEFVFQELVYPYKKRIPAKIEKLTGITNEMVKNSKKIWQVFPEFTEFIGDNILLGYNCMSFDSKFLVRAGRLSNLIINNEYFDVIHFIKKYKNLINSRDMTLVEVGKSLNIDNPQAHRALADAITTAKIYLKLKEKINYGEGE